MGSSCKSKVDATSLSTKNELFKDMEKAIVKDYTTRSEGCTFLLSLNNNEHLLIPDQLPKEYQKENMKVWIRYAPSARNQGNCNFGNPITLIDIVNRE